MRAALGPTVVWDFAVGVLLAGIHWHDGLAWALSSLLLIYFAGMILNDWRDVALDREVGRRRPLVDGRIKPMTALVVAILMLAAGYVCALRSGPYLGDFALWLIGIVVVYDLAGADLRRHIGPALLASARAFSLCFGVIASYGANNIVPSTGLAAPLSYALFFMFVSRLAQREERGVRGLNGMAYLVMAAVTPALIAQFERPDWLFYLAWTGVAALILMPAAPRRHDDWSPQVVQQMVGRALSLAPLIPALALLASDAEYARIMAPAAIGVCWLVGRLMRSYST